VARNGALKKVGFFFLPFLGFSLDFVIYIMTQKMGVNINTKGMFGISTCCWLIGTEGLSIADNLNDMGVPVPKFLINAYIKVKKIVEKSTEGEDVK
jgi:phage-related holin